MPTEADIFDKTLRMTVGLYTEPCPCTTGEHPHPGKCYVCNGEGTIWGDPGPQAPPEAWRSVRIPCPRPDCDDGVCQWCKGTLKNIPDEYSAVVVSGMAFGWTQVMNVARSAEKFSLFNVQWDLWTAWLAKHLRTAGPPTEEEMAKLAEAVTDMIEEPTPDKAPIQLIGGELSPDEMRELGLTEDD